MLPPGRDPAPLLFEVLAAMNGVPSGVVWLTPLHELAPATPLVVADMVTTMLAVVLFGATSDQSSVRRPAAFVARELATALKDCAPKVTPVTLTVLLDHETPTSRSRLGELPTANDVIVHVVPELIVQVLLDVLSPVTICACATSPL